MQRETEPLVSVVMACYNDEPRFLDQALQSIADQSYRNWELVVVDDSTSAATRELLDRRAAALGPHMLLDRSPARLGFVRSLNRGLSLARGEFIARMDGDDISLPDRLGLQVEYLLAHSDVGILGGAVQVISSEGLPLGLRRYKTSSVEIEKSCFLRNPLAHPAVMLRRSVIEEVGGYDERFRKAEDYELWLRALRHGKVIGNVEQVVLQYRVSGGYAAKRDRSNWRYATRAKLRNFDWKRPLRSGCGVGLSIALGFAPRALVNRLYERDHESPYLFG